MKSNIFLKNGSKIIKNNILWTCFTGNQKTQNSKSSYKELNKNHLFSQYIITV